MFGIDWNLDGDVDIIDDLLTLELLSEDNDEEDEQINIVTSSKLNYNLIDFRKGGVAYVQYLNIPPRGGGLIRFAG